MNKLKFLGVLIFCGAAFTAGAQQVQQEPIAPATPVMPIEVVFESSVGDVRFPHNLHLKFGCTMCHHQIHAAELETPHPEYMESSWITCGDCHAKESALTGNYYRCSDCHHSEPENIADETLSSKVVVHQSCWKCHESGTGRQASSGCDDCHVKEQQ
jgi:c(7)-type cytochrome triheme protein